MCSLRNLDRTGAGSSPTAVRGCEAMKRWQVEPGRVICVLVPTTPAAREPAIWRGRWLAQPRPAGLASGVRLYGTVRATGPAAGRSGRVRATMSAVSGERRKTWWLMPSALLVASAGAIVTATAWLMVRNRPGWSDNDKLIVTGLAAGIASALAGFVQQYIDRWRSERLLADRPTEYPIPRDVVESWRSELWAGVRERRVDGDRSQLGQILRLGSVVEPRVKVGIQLVPGDNGSRLHLPSDTDAFIDLASQWSRFDSRLVILGEPGYGKTVAALSLVAQANGVTNQEGRPVAELFPLSEWAYWSRHNPDESLQEWLAHQVAATYPTIGKPVARMLVDMGLVVPVVDGLDEVPSDRRAACAVAVKDYMGYVAEFRPMAMTCRPIEYQQLAPIWNAEETSAALVGIDRHQIVRAIHENTRRVSAWQPVVDRLKAGDDVLERLLRSPLRLSLALHVYGQSDPRELLDRELRSAENLLWQRLVDQTASGFKEASADDVRRWLTFLASGMKAHDRQRFWLHELYLYAPLRPLEVRRFKLRMAIGAALLRTGVSIFLLSSFTLLFNSGIDAAAVALTLAVSFVPGGVALVRFLRLKASTFEQPTIQNRNVTLRVRASSFARSCRASFSWRRDRVVPLYAAALYGVLFGVIGVLGFLEEEGDQIEPPRGLLVGVAGGVLLGLLGGSLLLLWRSLRAGVQAMRASGRLVLAAEPIPRQLPGPSTVMDQSLKLGRRTGLRGLVIGSWPALIFGGGAVIVEGVTVGLLVTLSCIVGFGGAGFVIAWMSSGNAWFYHQWLRRDLARQGSLPRELDAFLAWSADPGRSWLRISDAYEFRHRHLQEYLATHPPDADHPRPTNTADWHRTAPDRRASTASK